MNGRTGGPLNYTPNNRNRTSTRFFEDATQQEQQDDQDESSDEDLFANLDKQRDRSSQAFSINLRPGPPGPGKNIVSRDFGESKQK